ncbi:hypothetical protein GCK72_012894 [Caenorhabditis remanei]|uniref:Glycosyltransferase family 92 protein n=1 Tax=Caenorhabditis remanei TaxID=31234 RepID=A0A6A5GP03_CAERE|nr:hypothetical protein GCK72_012894 [Caenorhabditis remanei]KAF1756441.1 hypothetical protein GCK72_012894 [Caenorhabditis remanei]
MSCYRNCIKCMLLLFLIGLAVLNTYSYWKDSLNVNTEKTSMHPEVTVEQSSITPFHCPFESWNQVHSDIVPNENLHLEWIQNNISRRDNILESQIRLLSSFVYPDHISIITNSQRSYGQKVYCRYYNCLREEISNSSYQSIFFPMNVIRCPRRIGVKYMSISFDSEEIPQEPIPLVYRVFEAPIHEVSVCVGPIYGSESKWLEVVEFIEHYKLIGVRYFYFTVFNMNEYSRKIIDEYLRTGEIELTVIQSEYKTIDWQFHLLQINECHQRSKHHSKWVINVDIDERLVILDDKIKSVGSLLSGYNDTVAEVGFAIRRIQLRHYRTIEKNILGSGWLIDPNYKNFTIVPEETEFAEKLKENIRAAMDRGQCGIFNVAPFLECASQGKDNSECCRHRGIVQKTPSTTPFQCPVESWNQVHSDIVPNENLPLEWIQNNISRRDNILESQIRLLSSFVYPDYISIITNSQRSYGTGEIVLTVIQSEYKTIDWQFHLLQINECHQRSKHHSRWVINVDIDERLVILDDKINSVGSLLSGYNDTVAEIISEMEFLKYNVSSPVTWCAYKTIYRPEKIAAMYYHWAYQMYPETVAEYVKSEIALFRHYRTTEKNILGAEWLTDPNYKNFSIVPEETKFAEKLKENILKKIKYVYDQRVLNCEEIAEIPYEEYKEFGHDIFNCTFRNETGSNKSVD